MDGKQKQLRSSQKSEGEGGGIGVARGGHQSSTRFEPSKALLLPLLGAASAMSASASTADEKKLKAASAYAGQHR